MNKRELNKKKTRSKILASAKELFLQQGIANTSTYHIAKQSSIAHGTIFVHFKSKDDLICQVFITLLKSCAQDLEEEYDKGTPFDDLLDIFFQYIQSHENIFELYFCELPRYSIYVKKTTHSFEIALRNIFYYALQREGVQDKEITLLLNLLFAQLLYYYSYKEVLCGDRPVIEAFGPSIKESLKQYIQGGTYERKNL